MSLPRVLIITYYWPPSAGSGVQRWLKFAKYLPDYGWEPVIFTPENPDFELQDPSLENDLSPQLEVIKFPIWEPYHIFRRLKNQKSGDTAKVLEKKDKSWTDKLGIWLRANIIIPDPRVFWVKPSVGFLEPAIRRGDYQAIITTGPPHSMHLIGLGLHQKTGIPWLADFRDPWSTWEFLDTLPMLSLVRKRHQTLEKRVLKLANAITTISPTFQKDLKKLADREVYLLTNGFDSDDFPKKISATELKEKDIEIVYSGVIDAIRNPLPFLDAFKKAFDNSSKTVRLRFVGKVSITVEDFVKADSWLAAHVEFVGYVSHQKVFEYYQAADILLLILTITKNAQGNIPGKLFEYMASGKTIIGLGDAEGDAASIINQAQAGKVFTQDQQDKIITFLQEFKPAEKPRNQNLIENYSRKNLSRQLAEILDKLAP
ncbi:MAG: glycosyltransferase family 4 protein [Cecembia sp.]